MTTLTSTTFIPHLHEGLPKELETAKSLCVASALFSEEGVSQLREHTHETAKVEVLVGLDLPTSPAALQRLLAWSHDVEHVTVRVWTTKGVYFHPKVYLVEQSTGWVAFVGSANCTTGGWQNNEELTARVSESAAENLRQEWFTTRFAAGVSLTAEFVDAYSSAYEARAAADKAARNAAKAAQQEWQEWLEKQRLAEQKAGTNESGENGLGRPVRAGQYFQEVHFAAFDGQKPRSRDAAINCERLAVYDRLFELHEEMAPRIRATGWDLQPHYEKEHIVSSWKHGEYTEDLLRAMWLNYGRSKPEIKVYGDQHTPMHFLRLEVIIFNNHLAMWCRIGKDGAIDRDIFKRKLRRPENQQAFFALIQGLGDGYFVQVQDDQRPNSQFTDATALAEFVKTDKQGHYFIIGKDYQPNDPEVSETTLVDTVIRDWGLLYRVYQWMKQQD